MVCASIVYMFAYLTFLLISVFSIVNDLISVRQLTGCASLELLTLFDTPISTQTNYRHFAVNVIQTLSALDHFVISDEVAS